MKFCKMGYSENPPYGALLRPLFYGRGAKRPYIFLFKNLVNTVTR